MTFAYLKDTETISEKKYNVVIRHIVQVQKFSRVKSHIYTSFLNEKIYKVMRNVPIFIHVFLYI